MKNLFLIFLVFIFLFSQSANAVDFRLNRAIKNGDSVKFLTFEGAGQWDNYLAMNLAFKPMEDLFKQLQQSEKKPLTNRGEAHITVVTPVEYWNKLRPRGVSMAEVNKIAETMNIQKSKFEIVCLGKGTALVNEKTEETFFVVVQSEDLINIRKEIQKLLISKGGSSSEFGPMNYYPHITLGFTKRDLHESDGVLKGRNSCVSGIELF